MSKRTSWLGQRCRSRIVLSMMAGLLSVAVAMPAMAQVPNVCIDESGEPLTCQNLPTTVCDGGGFTVTRTGYTPANTTNGGVASYTYQICAPKADGLCSNIGGSCQDNQDCNSGVRCITGGQNPNKCSNDTTKSCSADGECYVNSCTGGTSACRVDQFQGLSHYDIFFPELGASSCVGVGKCTSDNSTQCTTDKQCEVVNGGPGGTCATPVTGSCSSGTFTLGDGSLETQCELSDRQDNYGALVAKCDSPTMDANGCFTMTVNIAGETNGLGLGSTVVLSKESTDCHASCLSGPSCDRCDTTPPGGNECLTRTIGFWGTHPWITNDYDPVTVCGKPLDCAGPDDGKSNPSCLAGSCTSIMEGLGSIGGELPKSSAYVAFIKQLTAAKLNRNATAALFSGASCSSWSWPAPVGIGTGQWTIQRWIDFCEQGIAPNVPSMCTAGQSQISGSGCIEALDAFNNSQDTGFAQTPAPFDRPSVDDKGNVSGADPSEFTEAHGNGGNPKFVIGQKVGSNDCR